MSPLRPSQRVILFGDFSADLQSGELRKHGHRIKLQVQPFQVLRILLEHPGEVVSRKELQKIIWSADTFVDFDQGLNNAVKKLREALNDDAEAPRFIETVPKRGYRLVAPMEGLSPASVPNNAPIAESRVRAGLEQISKVQLTSATLSRRTIASLVETLTESWRAKYMWMAVAGSGLALILTISGVYMARNRLWRGPTSSTGKIMFAVLPFENLSGDPEQEYFSDGLTEEMISRLGQVEPQRLGVIARTSAIQYKGTKKRIDQIGKELAVAYILEGTVRQAGGRVRVSAQLIQVKDQTHLWAKNYDRELRDILSVQKEVAQAIAGEVEIKLDPERQARLESARVDPEAYEAYLKGRFFFNQRTPDGIRNAVKQFNQAVTRDPGFALAYAGLSDAHSLLHYYNFRPRMDAIADQKSAALKAVALDDSVAETHTSLAQTFVDEWSWPAAEKEFQQAIEINPNYSLAHLWYSWFLQYQSRLGEAASEAQRALELDPLGTVSNANLGYIYAERRQFDQAIVQLQKSSELNPDYADPHLELANVFFLKHQYPEGFAELRKAADLSGQKRFASCVQVAIRADPRTPFQKSMEELSGCRVRASKSELLSSYDTAVEYAFAENSEKAFEWLGKAYHDHDDWLSYLAVDPSLERLHNEPRFQDLLRRIGLPQ